MTLSEYLDSPKDAHGRTRLYRIWENMRSRCYRTSKGKTYQRYGGRGIRVCEEWRASFEIFRDWAILNGYEESLELDRIDNDKDYEPSNCRFVSHRENSWNRRNGRMIYYEGKRMCLAEWSEELGINYETLRTRFRLNWSVERAFTTEVRKDKKQN